MKKLLLLPLFMVMIFGITMAHPPKKVEVSYNKENSILKIVATHGVKDSTTHYINKFNIFVDGELVKTIEETSQTNTEVAEFEYELTDIEAGSEIKVKATCNKSGSRAAAIVVE